MRIDGVPCRTIWPEADGKVGILDQTVLPHRVQRLSLTSAQEAARAIADMQVRGAPLIGATAAYGYAFAMREDPSDANLHRAYERLYETRPTAVNLRWALDELKAILAPLAPAERFQAASARPLAASGRSAPRMRIKAQRRLTAVGRVSANISMAASIEASSARPRSASASP